MHLFLPLEMWHLINIVRSIFLLNFQVWALKINLKLTMSWLDAAFRKFQQFCSADFNTNFIFTSISSVVAFL